MSAFTETLSADKIREALINGSARSLAGRYATHAGRVCVGLPVSEAAGALRNAGYKQVGRVDEFDLRAAAVEVVDGQYVGGARPTGRFVRVAVARWIEE